ncbi:MAG: hypothetical protein AAGE52_03030 [Myxococcota bacterium]
MRLFVVVGLVFSMVSAFGCGKSSTREPDAGIEFDASRPDVPVEEDAAVPDSDVPVDSDIGEACRTDDDCADLCIEDFPGGYCTALCGGGTGCPDGSTCTPVGGGQEICLRDCDPVDEDPCGRMFYGCTNDFRFPSVCLPGCRSNADCPDGQACDPDGDLGQGTCFNPDAELGDACTDSEECDEDGFCLAEFFAGWPGGACLSFGCDVAGNTGCEGDGQCLPSPRGGGLCFGGCETDDDCRDGYSCEADDDFPDRMFCSPACEDDSACSGGRECNPALGTCDDPFDADELGDPCSTVMGACAGGTCFTEFASGFPGSYCTFTGCDATMPDADDGCPGDGVCVANGGDNVCIDGCEDDRDCRSPDYTCRQVDRDDPSKGLGCFPSCENDDACANDGTGMSPDFSCNPGTGLCTDPFEAARLGEPCEDGDDCPGGRCESEAGDGFPAGTCVALGCRLSGTGPEQACPAEGVCVDDEEGDPEIGICLVACDTEASGECRSGYGCVALGTGTEGACRPACESDTCTGGRTCNDSTGLCESS